MSPRQSRLPTGRRAGASGRGLPFFLLATAFLAAPFEPSLAAAPALKSNERVRAAGVPDDAALEAAGAVIGTIRFVRHNIFDTALDAENKAPYRFANRVHSLTRESVIRKKLLFEPGDPYSHRLLAETARLLRAQPYLRDAEL